MIDATETLLGGQINGDLQELLSAQIRLYLSGASLRFGFICHLSRPYSPTRCPILQPIHPAFDGLDAINELYSVEPLAATQANSGSRFWQIMIS